VRSNNSHSGIDHEKENYPDKEYLILLIATLSNGQDEIFRKDYYPQPGQKRKPPVAKPTLQNDDGLFNNVPAHLLAIKGQRSLKMVWSNEEEKNWYKIHLADQRIQTANENKLKLQQDIARQVARRTLKEKEKEAMNMDDMRIELEKVMKKQAEEYIQLELQKREQVLQG